jgi:chromosome segregation ATPase
MLVLAAAFALGGTALVGSQTFDLRKELNDQGAAAKQDIAALQAANHDEMVAQAAEMKRQHDAAIKEIDDGKKDIAARNVELSGQQQALLKDIGSKRQDIDSYVNNLKSGLHDTSVQMVVAELRQQLEKEMSQIEPQIVGPLTKLRDEDLTTIQAKASAVGSTIDTLSSQTAEANRKLTLAMPTINDFDALITRVNTAVQQTHAAQDTVNANAAAVATALANARKSESDASQAASLADAHAQAAKQAQTDVANRVQQVGSEATAQMRTLGTVDDQMKTLNNSITDLTKQAATLRDTMKNAAASFEAARQAGLQAGAMASDLTSLRGRINTMEQDLADQRVAVDKARQTTETLVNGAENLHGTQVRISALEPAVDTISGRAAEISKRLDAATTETGQLQGKVDTLARSVATLEQRVGDLRADAGKGSAGTPVSQGPGPAAPPPQTPSADNDHPSGKPEIAAMQSALAKLKLYHGNADGLEGPLTHQAEAAYQQHDGATPTGTLSRAQYQQLLGK